MRPDSRVSTGGSAPGWLGASNSRAAPGRLFGPDRCWWIDEAPCSTITPILIAPANCADCGYQSRPYLCQTHYEHWLRPGVRCQRCYSLNLQRGEPVGV